MPLTSKGEEIKSNMENEYGEKKGEGVFYASANKGTIKGVHTDRSDRMSKDMTTPDPSDGPMSNAGPNGESEGLPKTVEPFSEVKDGKKADCAMSLDEIKSNAKRIGRY